VALKPYGDEDYLPLSSLVLTKIMETGFEMDEEELYLYIDTELATSEEMTDEAIIKEVQGSQQEEQEEEEEVEKLQQKQKTQALHTSRNYHHWHGIS